jgi:hypothetical protein
MIGLLWSQTDARSVIEPEAPTFWLFAWDFQPFPPPDAIHALDADAPAFLHEQLPNAPVAVTPVLGRQSDDGPGERCLIVTNLWLATLAGARLTDNHTCASFGDG